MLSTEEIKKLKTLKLAPKTASTGPKQTIGKADVLTIINHMRSQKWESFTAGDIHNHLIALGKVNKRSTWAATIGSILDDMGLEVLRPKGDHITIIYRVPNQN